jgi:hypothetical protein
VTALIVLTPDQVADAVSLAEATYERWKSAPGYYRNTLSSHRKGKLGEVAADLWACDIGLRVEPWYRDPAKERNADLRLNLQRFDVKTWDVTTWESMGRCVRPGQVAALRRKAEGILWCFVDEKHDQVCIAGWSTIDEIAALPVVETGPVGRTVENHQMPVGDMHGLDELLARLR